MITFFRNYPHKFYLQTFLRTLSKTKIVFALQENRVRMLVRGEKSHISTYLPDVQNHPGAPVPGATRAAPFRAILASHKVPVGGKFVFLVGSEVETRLLGSEALQGIESAERLRNTAPNVLLPTFDRHSQYEWEFLTPGLERVGAHLPSQVIMVGIPTKVRRWIEGWAEQIGGEVVAIVPHVIAAHLWCVKQGAKDFLLLLGSKESHLTLIQDGQLRLLERHTDCATMAKDPEVIATHIRALCAEIKAGTLYVCRGDAAASVGRQVRDELEHLIPTLRTQLLEPSADAAGRIKAADTPSLDAYIMESLT